MTNPITDCKRVGWHYIAFGKIVAHESRTYVNQGPKNRCDFLPAAEVGLTSRHIFEAANQGDALAERIVAETAYYLAVGTVNMLHTIDPDMVVFGGGMIAAGEAFLNLIRNHVKELAFPVPAEKTRLCYAKLGTDAGFIGAAANARLLVLKTKNGLLG